ARRETGLDLREAAGDDLDIEDRHEHADDHDDEGHDVAGRHRRQRRPVGERCRARAVHQRARAASAAASDAGARVSTSTSAERPGRSSPRSFSSGASAMRTGTRCTILVKLPVAFAGGSRLKSEPLAGAKLSMKPWRLRSGKASTVMRTFSPGRM